MLDRLAQRISKHGTNAQGWQSAIGSTVRDPSEPAAHQFFAAVAATWTYQCSTPGDNCSATTFVDEAGGMEGTAVYMTTGALFDFAAIAPAAHNLGLNASGLHFLGFYVKAKNTNSGTSQPPTSGLPIIVLGSPSGTLTYEPSTVLLPSDGSTWAYIEIPLAPPAGSGWTLTNSGGSLSLVNWVEIHADTWGGGFDLWFDTVTFY